MPPSPTVGEDMAHPTPVDYSRRRRPRESRRDVSHELGPAPCRDAPFICPVGMRLARQPGGPADRGARMPGTSHDLHGNAPDTHPVALLLLLGVINPLD